MLRDLGRIVFALSDPVNTDILAVAALLSEETVATISEIFFNIGYISSRTTVFNRAHILEEMGLVKIRHGRRITEVVPKYETLASVWNAVGERKVSPGSIKKALQRYAAVLMETGGLFRMSFFAVMEVFGYGEGEGQEASPAVRGG